MCTILVQNSACVKYGNNNFIQSAKKSILVSNQQEKCPDSITENNIQYRVYPPCTGSKTHVSVNWANLILADAWMTSLSHLADFYHLYRIPVLSKITFCAWVVLTVNWDSMLNVGLLNFFPCVYKGNRPDVNSCVLCVYCRFLCRKLGLWKWTSLPLLSFAQHYSEPWQTTLFKMPWLHGEQITLNLFNIVL